MTLNSIRMAELHIPDRQRAEAELAELTHSAGVELGLAETYSYRDATDSISFTVDRHRMVVDVRIAPTWTDRISLENLPGSLYSTYVRAVQRALAVEMKHRATVDGVGGPPTSDASLPSDLPLDEWIAAIRTRLDAVDDEYDAIRRQPPRADPPDVIEVRSPRELLAMGLRGRNPVGMRLITSTLSGVAADALAVDVRQLFARAHLGTAPEAPARRSRPASVGDDPGDDDYYSNFDVYGKRG